ncbi:MAG: hypothetical protein ACTSW1_05475 [Candidatus Hodarchaeales archaeon]
MTWELVLNGASNCYPQEFKQRAKIFATKGRRQRMLQNPDQSETQETENKEDMVLETARKLAKGEMTLEDIKDPAVAREFHDRFVLENEEIPESNEVKAKVEENKDPEINETQTQTVESVDENQTFLQERKRKYDEINNLNQKIENKRKRLGELDTVDTTVHKKVNGEEIFSEQTNLSTQDRLQVLERNQRVAVESEKVNLEAENLELANRKVFMEIDSFQFENPELKTSKSMTVLNAGYAKFITDIGGLENVDKFRTDKEYKTLKESEGFVFPMSDTDYGKFEKISGAIKYKRDNNHPDLDSAYYKFRKENGIVTDDIKQASINAASATLRQVAENADGTQTLSPDDGTGGGGKDEMSRETMERWILANPEPKTPQQVAMMKAIQNQLFGGV